MHGFPKSLLLGTPATLFGTSQTFGQPTSQGQAFDTNASFAGVYFARSDGTYASAAQTHIAVATYAAFAGAYAGLFSTSDASGNGSLTLQYSSQTDVFVYVSNTLGSAATYFVPSLTGVPFVVGCSADSTGSSLYESGEFVVTVQPGGAPSVYPTSRLILLGERTTSTSYATKGTCSQHLFYQSVLSVEKHRRIGTNPWQIFHRRRRAYSLITSSTISASISEAVTSSDAYALSATAAAAITAAATSSDAYALAATVPSAISEEIYPSDAYALAVTIAAALDSSAAASSALSAVATIAATIADVSSAQDTLGVTATVLAAIAEAATATDTQVTRSVTSAEYAESATAAAIFSATVSIAATLTEAGLAADQIAAMATVAADLAESGAASDAYLSSVLLAVELLENAAAADELSAAAFEQIIDAAKTIITILQAQDTVTMVQARDTLRILQ